MIQEGDLHKLLCLVVPKDIGALDELNAVNKLFVCLVFLVIGSETTLQKFSKSI
jgi:hypothetical protein